MTLDEHTTFEALPRFPLCRPSKPWRRGWGWSFEAGAAGFLPRLALWHSFGCPHWDGAFTSYFFAKKRHMALLSTKWRRWCGCSLGFFYRAGGAALHFEKVSNG